MENALSKRARDILGPGWQYARRDRHPDEPAPRTALRKKWEPRHPDLQFVIVRADRSREIKSRGM